MRACRARPYIGLHSIRILCVGLIMSRTPFGRAGPPPLHGLHPIRILCVGLIMSHTPFGRAGPPLHCVHSEQKPSCRAINLHTLLHKHLNKLTLRTRRGEPARPSNLCNDVRSTRDNPSAKNTLPNILHSPRSGGRPSNLPNQPSLRSASWRFLT